MHSSPAATGIWATTSPEALSTLRGKRFNVNNRRVREVLGWAPKISLEQSLRDTMAAIRAARAAHLTGESA